MPWWGWILAGSATLFLLAVLLEVAADEYCFRLPWHSKQPVSDVGWSMDAPATRDS